MDKFINAMDRGANIGVTENGAIMYKETLSSTLDMFSQLGSARDWTAKQKTELFLKAYNEDALLATKCLFYIRDIRTGVGERQTFRDIIKELGNSNLDIIDKNIHLIIEYGRYDDMLCLLDTKAKDLVIRLFKKQLMSDWDKEMVGEFPSLLGKWLPSENASSKETKRLAKIVRTGLKVTPKEYRKILSSLRKQIGIVETDISNGKYDNIDYSKLPSRAAFKYRNAFIRHDEARYEEFLEAVSKGEVNINTGDLYPSDIIMSIKNKCGWSGYGMNELETKAIDISWKNLDNFLEGTSRKIFPLIDVSGSMSSVIHHAVGLGMYFSENNVSEYKDKYITFSTTPRYGTLEGDTIVERYANLIQADWDMSTNFESALMLILDTAVRCKLSQDDIPTDLLVLSDMHFNSASRGNSNGTFFDVMKERFEKHGYTMPNFIMWNLDARGSISPFEHDSRGFIGVSGYSHKIIKYLVKGDYTYQLPTPMELMLDTLNSDRYSAVRV